MKIYELYQMQFHHSATKYHKELYYMKQRIDTGSF